MNAIQVQNLGLEPQFASFSKLKPLNNLMAAFLSHLTLTGRRLLFVHAVHSLKKVSFDATCVPIINEKPFIVVRGSESVVSGSRFFAMNNRKTFSFKVPLIPIARILSYTSVRAFLLGEYFPILHRPTIFAKTPDQEEAMELNSRAFV